MTRLENLHHIVSRLLRRVEEAFDLLPYLIDGVVTLLDFIYLAIEALEQSFEPVEASFVMIDAAALNSDSCICFSSTRSVKARISSSCSLVGMGLRFE